MKIDRTGCTRIVILTRRYAIKLPNCLDGWPRLFYQGLLANLQEASFSSAGWPELCPVVFALPWGFGVVMPRCQLLTDDEFLALGMPSWVECGDYVVPVEAKSNSFGWLNGRVVAIDYGN